MQPLSYSELRIMKAFAASDGCPECTADVTAFQMTETIKGLTGMGLIANDLALTPAGRRWLEAYGCPVRRFRARAE